MSSRILTQVTNEHPQSTLSSGPAFVFVEKRSSASNREFKNASAIIHEHCKNEWPSDFEMRAYCEKKQFDALEELQK
jgi:hypothetical protein